MRADLLDSKEVCHLKAIFDSIERSLGTFSFSSVFSLVLTDRGGEFRNPAALECGQENLIRTSIYYCDPMCSWQKPHCEKNHEYIRKICPKGTSFDGYSQDDEPYQQFSPAEPGWNVTLEACKTHAAFRGNRLLWTY